MCIPSVPFGNSASWIPQVGAWANARDRALGEGSSDVEWTHASGARQIARMPRIAPRLQHDCTQQGGRDGKSWLRGR